MLVMVHHHVKYLEIHGVDEVVLMPKGEHIKLHNRLRREGKCNIPRTELAKISYMAYNRRAGLYPSRGTVLWRTWRMFRAFEFENTDSIIG